MSKLSQKDIEKVANLAQITLNKKEVELYREQLSSVVDYIGQLSEVDTEGVEPVAQTTGLENVVRVDTLKPQGLTADEATGATEEKHNDLFKVKAILKDSNEE